MALSSTSAFKRPHTGDMQQMLDDIDRVEVTPHERFRSKLFASIRSEWLPYQESLIGQLLRESPPCQMLSRHHRRDEIPLRFITLPKAQDQSYFEFQMELCRKIAEATGVPASKLRGTEQ